MSAQRSALADVEVVELLADRPELLAIADAVAATQAQPRRRRLLLRLLPAAVVLVLALAAVPLAPWPQREGGFVERALAAIGPLPVVHVVIETEDPYSSLVDLETGEGMPTRIRLEYWFDEERGRLRSVQLRNGVFTGETLEVAGGGRSSSGPVQALPGSRPSLNPALAGFVRGYKQALADGTATVVGEGEVEGRRVMWVAFPTSYGSERAAVDSETLRPVLVRAVGPGGEASPFTWRVPVIETIARRASDFREPRLMLREAYRGDVRSSEPISSANAAELPWRPVWLGESWRGLRLVRLERQTVTRGYLPGSEPRSERGESLRLGYRVDAERWRLELSQAPRPEMAYAFAGGRRTFVGNPLPPEGAAEIVTLGGGSPGSQCIGQLQLDGVWVTIWGASRGLCLDAARSLKPLSVVREGK